ncbi:MAG: hypothetical protein U0528_20375 [Anaerolineae bacterium]
MKLRNPTTIIQHITVPRSPQRDHWQPPETQTIVSSSLMVNIQPAGFGEAAQDDHNCTGDLR